MVNVTCEAASLLTHWLNEAAVSVEAGEIGGANKAVEADEAYVGGRKKAYGPPPKKMAKMAACTRRAVARIEIFDPCDTLVDVA
ncbi:hypothetical protein [Bradyrhizobium sp. JR3.5]